MKFLHTVFLLFICAPYLEAQFSERSHQFHSWFYYIGDHKISDKWGVHPEVQFRRTGFGNKPQEFLIRGAVNYHPLDFLMISLGYVYARQYPYGVYPADFEFPEHRTYLQLEFEHKLNIFDVVHRFRQEQRWIAEIVGVPDTASPGGIMPVTQGWPFQNRMRYSVGGTFPLSGREIDHGEFYVYVSNETFFSFGKNVSNNSISQNRTQGGLGYQFGSFGRLEMGYLLQIIRDPDILQVENNHTVVLAWISRFDLKR